MKKFSLIATAVCLALSSISFISCEKEDKDAISIDVVQKGTQKIQGIDGKEYEVVDLGFPSKILWATCNIGATSPEKYGDYFAWGEIQSKAKYDWTTYNHCNGSKLTIKKYYKVDENYGSTDGKLALDSIDDAATQLMGEKWNMPLRRDFSDLISRCDWKYCKLNGVWGCLFTSKENGNSLFLPHAGLMDVTMDVPEHLHTGSYGYYWSADLYDTQDAYTLYFDRKSNPVHKQYQSREIGLPIRPVTYKNR